MKVTACYVKNLQNRNFHALIIDSFRLWPYDQMSASNTIGIDIIGPSVNMCCKINRLAEPNGIVIGGDLHQVGLDMGFDFCKTKSYSLGLKNDYPVFSLCKFI